MRLSRIGVIVMFMVLFTALSSITAQETTEEPEVTDEPTAVSTSTPIPTATTTTETSSTGETIYIVQRGDNLFRIALQYGLTTEELAAANGISNTGQIFVGQRLVIPGTGTSGTTTTTGATPTPTATAVGETVTAASAPTYTVQAGDTLFSIAQRNNTTVDELVVLNNLTNVNTIYVGQVLVLPGGEETTTASITDPGGELPEVDLFYGLEIYIAGQDINAITAQIQQLGFTWAKVNVDWRNLEPEQGNINFIDLDAAVNTLNANGINILLTISTAPDWARPSASAQQMGEDGPPDDFADFATFVSALATRYTGKVQAYQIWNEPNLRREWASGEYPIRADHYMDLVRAADEAIEAVDPDALVISAGLAPTGFNDGVNAIDDRVFLQDMFSNDAATIVDAIGAHPNGWANPPASTCCDQSEGVETHFDNERFYFLNTLEAYRAVINRNGASAMPIWITRFGWGTADGSVIQEPSDNNVFLTYTDLEEQATYVGDAFALGEELGFVGGMFLNNLNGCQANDAEACYYSLIDANNTARPSFLAVRSIGLAQASSQTAEVMEEAEMTQEAAPVIEATPTATEAMMEEVEPTTSGVIPLPPSPTPSS